MIDRFLGDENDGEGTSPTDDGGNDDLLGEDLGGDEFGDDLGLDEMEDDGADLEELEHNVTQLEDEVGSLSSNVNTIKNEHEHLRDDVEAIRDNVRQLLEIYEMVTTGVNPFEDETEFGEAFDMETMGMFEQPDEAEVADDLDETLPLDEPETPDPIEDDMDETEGTEDSTADERTFDDLRAEYEDGSEAANDDQISPSDSEDSAVSDTHRSPSPSTDGETHSDAIPAPDAIDPSQSAIGEKPFLQRLPDGYAGELIVLQWLTFLNEETDSASAGSAIEYYRSIEWISDEVADTLHIYLDGLGADIESDFGDDGDALSVEAHTQSLQYIHQLARHDPRTVVVTDEDDLVDGLVSTDASHARTAVTRADGPLTLRPRTDGGPQTDRLSVKRGWTIGSAWIRASEQLEHGGER